MKYLSNENVLELFFKYKCFSFLFIARHFPFNSSLVTLNCINHLLINWLNVWFIGSSIASMLRALTFTRDIDLGLVKYVHVVELLYSSFNNDVHVHCCRMQ